MSTPRISLPQLWEGNTRDEQGKLPHATPSEAPWEKEWAGGLNDGWKTTEKGLRPQAPLCHVSWKEMLNIQVDSKTGGGFAAEKELPWKNIHNTWPYGFPQKSQRANKSPHGDACLSVSHVSNVLKIRFYRLFLDICFYWLSFKSCHFLSLFRNPHISFLSIFEKVATVSVLAFISDHAHQVAPSDKP